MLRCGAKVYAVSASGPPRLAGSRTAVASGRSGSANDRYAGAERAPVADAADTDTMARRRPRQAACRRKAWWARRVRPRSSVPCRKRPGNAGPTPASRYPRGKRVCQAERRVRRKRGVLAIRQPCAQEPGCRSARVSTFDPVPVRTQGLHDAPRAPSLLLDDHGRAPRRRPPPVHDRFLRRLSEGDEWKRNAVRAIFGLSDATSRLGSRGQPEWGRRVNGWSRSMNQVTRLTP